MKTISKLLIIGIVLLIAAGCAPAATPVATPTAAATTMPATTVPPATIAPTATQVPPTAATAATPIPPTATLAPGQRELTVMTHDSFNASDDVIAEFEKANNVRIRILKSGDAGAAVNKAILTKNNPLADMFYGVDNTFLSRALNADIFVPYQAKGLEKIPARFKLDAANRAIPIDYGDVCLNYDKAWFKQRSLTPPATLDDLTKPTYKNLLVVENPATSSPGLAFLFSTIAQFGQDKYLTYWKQLRDNNVLISDGWEDAYYGKSTWAGKGDRPIVVSYATSPAAEVFFNNMKEPPTGNVLGENACFRQIEFAAVLRGAKNPELAQRFIDYMVSLRFQEDVPGQMFVFPVLPDAKLPDYYKFAEQPAKPASLTAEQIDANRDKWISAWTSTVLR
ncbi:MAG TPA: thiamine ABC transporter substrate-binding protein [Anaerolineae bacterium]